MTNDVLDVINTKLHVDPGGGISKSRIAMFRSPRLSPRRQPWRQRAPAFFERLGVTGAVQVRSTISQRSCRAPGRLLCTPPRSCFRWFPRGDRLHSSTNADARTVAPASGRKARRSGGPRQGARPGARGRHEGPALPVLWRASYPILCRRPSSPDGAVRPRRCRSCQKRSRPATS